MADTRAHQFFGRAFVEQAFEPAVFRLVPFIEDS
jgi:hypothetical protein